MILQNFSEVIELEFREVLPDEYNFMMLSSVQNLFYLKSKGYTLSGSEEVQKYIRVFNANTFHYSSWLRFDAYGTVLDNTVYIQCLHHGDKGVKGVKLKLVKE